MKIKDSEQHEKSRRLVGEVTSEQLYYVDCFVTAEIGFFIPSF